MWAVIFEVQPYAAHEAAYLDTAASLLPRLQQMPGFMSVERFRSETRPERLLSLSKWQDEAALRGWREVPEHRAAQRKGRERLFEDYRLRVGELRSLEAGEAQGWCAVLEWAGDGLPWPDALAGLERYCSLKHEHGRAAIGSVQGTQALAACRLLLGDERAIACGLKLSLCAVSRDYGLNDRAQAPHENRT